MAGVGLGYSKSIRTGDLIEMRGETQIGKNPPRIFFQLVSADRQAEPLLPKPRQSFLDPRIGPRLARQVAGIDFVEALDALIKIRAFELEAGSVQAFRHQIADAVTD